MNSRLKAEIEKFRKFRTAPHWPNRLDDPIKPSVAQSHERILLQIMGWLHRFQGVPLEELSLDRLISPVKLKSAQEREAALREAEQAQEDAEQLICDYFYFLDERGAKSPSTRINILCVLLAVAKFQYHREITSRDYREVPVIERLRWRASTSMKEMKHHTPVADLEKKWLDLPEIFSKIVEPLRAECEIRNTDGKLRGRIAVAESFKRYILWGGFVYAPPRRQQELRELKIALSCPIKRPQGVGPDDLIHPLPTGGERKRNYGYLYRTPEGKWIKNLTPESYKTGKIYGDQDIEVPNIKFPDGKCFYDYLEAWLYGYYIAPDGGWRSCGSSFHPQGESNQRLYSGRMILNPINDYVFVQINGGKPFSESNLSKFISTAAHRLTGQRLTPHLLRDIYATHFLDTGATDDRIASLAYAMGHSAKMLRETYDRRHPQQKHRPIQEAVLDLVQQSLDPSSTFN